MKEKTVYLGMGCFWGSQKYFDLVRGVISTEVGYANGTTDETDYKTVCSGVTDHAEVVKVTYDADVLSLGDVLALFFEAIDPTAVDRQGNDVGRQYRTGVYYTDAADLPVIEAAIEAQRQKYGAVATEALPLKNYCKAEDYHQKYLDKTPFGYCHIGRREFDFAKNYKRK